MSEPYTPSMDEIRAHHGIGWADPYRDEMLSNFDRAIAAHDADVAAQAVTAERAKVVAHIRSHADYLEQEFPSFARQRSVGLRALAREIQAGAHDGGAES